MTIAYAIPEPATPTACPCLTCHEHGPYCAQACQRFDLWDAAGRPGRTVLLIRPRREGLKLRAEEAHDE